MEYMVISSGSRKEVFLHTVCMEVITEAKDEWQDKKKNTNKKTGRGCKEGIKLAMEQYR